MVGAEMEQKFKYSRDSKEFCARRAKEVGNTIHRASATDKNIAVA
jgi:hypothetical protein